jgi:hypothetical protein
LFLIAEMLHYNICEERKQQKSSHPNQNMKFE